MNAITKLAAATLITITTAGSAWAQDAHAGHGAHAQHQTTAAEATLIDGEIRKVDKEAGKVTIRHGEIKNLGMAPMTMVFRVKDAAMLDQVKAGDKVQFGAEKIDGAITVVQLEVAK